LAGVGVVLVELRDTEDGHHGVPDEPLDVPPVAGDHLVGRLEVVLHQRPEGLRVQLVGEGGGVHHVDEQNSDELAGPVGDGRQGTDLARRADDHDGTPPSSTAGAWPSPVGDPDDGQARASCLTDAGGRALLAALCRTYGGGRPMTAYGGTNPEMNWDEARIALGRVAQLFNENPEFTREDLYRLENYELVPQPVREALEGLTADERQVVKRIFTTLAQNHFYLEGGEGGLRFY
jgi:hypothetical protein